ncbi:phasin family protein [Palleronia sp. LCG004]|uniref:phasin family protein n=1 Tax=Palleronia sp. LCG004 TaxID=3079304 RepID=UPI002941F983|nr:phasin family protein [Palleronia sp. LCG004]WOI57676.1 phasin family protein [Palleronia sp. LCG004]
MANRQQKTKSAANDMQSLFDPQSYRSAFETWASSNERMSNVALEAGNRMTEVASDSARESFANIREVTQVREEFADYGKAYSDFMQKQMDLVMRSAQSFAEIAQNAGGQTTELVQKTGQEMGETMNANLETAANKATSATKSAA